MASKYVAQKFFEGAWAYVSGLVAPLFQRGSVVDVPLTDDLMVRLSVLDTVAAQSALAQDTRAEAIYARELDEVPTSIEAGIALALTAARPFMQRCTCHLDQAETGSVWIWSRLVRGNTVVGGIHISALLNPVSGYSISGHPAGESSQMDEFMAVLPFTCPNVFSNQLARPARASDCLLLPLRGAEQWVAVPGEIGHDVTSTRDHTCYVGRGGEDELGFWEPVQSHYKAHMLQNSVACTICHPECLHGFTPAFFTSAIEPGKRGRNPAARGLAGLGIAVNRAWLGMGSPRRVQVTGWDRDYCPAEWISSYGWPLIVVVKTIADAQVVAQRGHTPVMAEFAVSGSHLLANLRLVVAAVLPVGTLVHITNTFPRTNWLIDATLAPLAPIEASAASPKNAIACSILVTAGSVDWARTCRWSTFALAAGYYGLEEAVIEATGMVVTRADHLMQNPWSTASFHPGFRRMAPLVYRSVISGRIVAASGCSRAHSLTLHTIVLGWSRGHTSSVSWTTALSLPLGKPEAVSPLVPVAEPMPEVVRSGRPLTISGALSREVGRLNWFVFGSRGDIVPVIAAATTLKSWGIDVCVVNPLTDAQSRGVLEAAETGNLLRAAPLFLRTMSLAATAPGLVFGPPEFTAVATGVSLRPPQTVVHPPDFGAGRAINFIINTFLRGWAPTINIGAYAGPDWFARSHDGVNYLPAKAPTGVRDIDILLVWGSSTLPKPTGLDAVEPTDGDHIKWMSRAKVVVCHGGAGTVQTAAACGCRVVVATRILDRWYYDSLNAGAGVVAGDNPDAYMLALIPHSKLAMAWAYAHSWPMFWRACRLYVKWVLGPAIWVFFAIFVQTVFFTLRLPRFRIVFTMSFPSTIIASLMVSVVSPWWAMVLGPQIENLIAYVLAHTGWSYLALLLECLSWCAKASLSPVFWTTVLAGHPWVALPLTLGIGYAQVGSIVIAELLAFLMPSTSDIEQEVYASVGISWAWRGSNIPAFHTRLVSPDGTKVFEGEWVHTRQELGALYKMSIVPEAESHIPFEWRFPTRISWAQLETVQTLAAPYSPWWNCQTGVLSVVRGAWLLLGVSLVILIPSLVWLLVSMSFLFLLTMVLLILSEVVPVLALIMHALGHSDKLIYSRRLIYNFLATLTSNRFGWFNTSLAALVGMSVGWAEGGNQHLIAESILCAPDLPSLVKWMSQLDRPLSEFNQKLYCFKVDSFMQAEKAGARYIKP